MKNGKQEYGLQDLFYLYQAEKSSFTSNQMGIAQLSLTQLSLIHGRRQCEIRRFFFVLPVGGLRYMRVSRR